MFLNKIKSNHKQIIAGFTALVMAISSASPVLAADFSDKDIIRTAGVAEPYDPFKDESYLNKLKELESKFKGEELEKAKRELRESILQREDEISQTPLVSNLNSRASTTVKITAGSLNYNTYYKNSTNSYKYVTSSSMVDSRGYKAFCLNSRKYAPNGHNLTSSSKMDDGVYRILKNGWPNKSFTGNATTDRIITQGAVWAYADSGEIKMDNMSVYHNGAKDSKILNYVKDLYNIGKNGSETQKVSVSLSKPSAEAVQSGDYFYTDYVTLKGSGDIKQSSFKIKIESETAGIKLVDANGNVITDGGNMKKSISVGDKFRAVIPKKSYTGSLNLQAQGTVLHSVPVKYVSSNSSLQNVVILEDATESLISAKITLNWNGKGNFQLIKVNQDGSKKLEGAQFTLSKNGKVVQTLTTDSNGQATVKNLDFGLYKLKEVKAPTGYKLTSTEHDILLETSGTLKATITNSTAYGKVVIKKIDSATNNQIKGAEFSLKGTSATNGGVNMTIQSTTGLNEISLPIGSYTLTETKAPSGYVLKNNSANFDITKDGQVVNITVKNTPIVGSVRVTKVDESDSNKKLSGAVFGIYDANGTLLDKQTTDSNGVAWFSNYKAGKYTIKEVSAPQGYVATTTSQTVNIQKDDETIGITFKNKKATGNLQFSKTDVATGALVPGATIEIKGLDSTNSNIVKTFVSSSTVTNLQLPIGKYQIKETIAPQGYILSEEVGQFEITKDGQVVKASIVNRPILGSVEVIKIDSKTGDVLKGAEFAIYDSNNNLIQTKAVGTDGVVKFSDLKYGKYKIYETKSPDGYKGLDKELDVSITKHGEVITLKAKNERIPKPGILEFTKTDVSNGEVIEGAHILIKGLDEKNKDVKVSFVSSKSGNKFSLEAGRYSITETIAPNGYVLSKETKEFEIKPDGQITKANLTNKLINGSIEILKVDADNKTKVLQGAEFTLYKDGKLVKSVTTDSNGKAVFSNLPYGSYIIKETKSPQFYTANSEALSIEIKNDGEVIKKTVTNKVSTKQVYVRKIDSFTKQEVEGAEITIVGLDGNNKHITKTFKSGKQPTVLNLELGRYQVKEIKSPDKYNQTSQKLTFTVTETSEVIDIDLENSKIIGNIEITKVDKNDNTKKLQGAEFEVRQGDTIVQTGVTDANGVVRFTGLVAGEYKVVETKSPSNYKLEKTEINAKISEQDQTLTYTVSNKLLDGSLVIKKVDSKTKDVLEGAKLKVKGTTLNGKVVEQTITSSKEGNKISLPYGEYEITEIKSPQGYILSSKVLKAKISSSTNEVVVEYPNDRIVGNIEVVKVDEEDKNIKIEGAEFTLKKNGKAIKTAISGKDGVARFDNVEYGQYEIVESKAPVNYSLTDVVVKADVKEQGKTLTYTVSNRLLGGNLVIKKIDSKTKDVLEGAELKVKGTTLNGKVVDKTITSSKEGNKIELPYGEYEITEIKSPQGYILSSKVLKAKISSSTNEVVVEYPNDKIVGNIEMVKVDEEDKNIKIEGAEFTLKKNGKAIKTAVSGKDGVARFDNVEYGQYEIVESKAPVNYSLTDVVVKADVKEQGKTLTYTVSNRLLGGNLVIKKIDSKTKDVLEGAELKVKGTTLNGKVVEQTITSSKEGNKISLPYGEYEITEIKSPQGYVLSTQSIKAIINDNSKEVSVEFPNDKIEGIVEIVKVDSKNKEKKLSGAEFAIKKGEEVIKTAVTDDKGVARFEGIEYGEYKIVEVKSPANYKLSEVVVDVEIKEQDKVLTYTVENELLQGELLFKKVDSVTKEVLDGAEITIKGTALNGIEIEEKFVSSKDGNKLTLPYGDYEVTELKSPESYVVTKEKPKFSINDENKEVEIELENEKIKNAIEVTKVDSQNNDKVLEGAEFAIYKDGKEVTSGVTGNDGRVVFKDVEFGKYELREKTSPKGYDLSDKVVDINVVKEGEVIQIKYENDLSVADIIITKVSASNKRTKLQGAEFVLYNVDKKEVARGVSNEKGIVEFKNVPLGEYRLVEKKAPKGYKLDSTERVVKLSESKEVVELTIENSAILAQTGGSFTIGGVILSGIALIAVAVFILIKNK